MQRPDTDEFNPYFQKYIDLVETNDPIKELKQSMHLLQAYLSKVPELQGNYRYSDGKWTVKEVLVHLMDVERVMAYRALVISRKDETKLMGFDDQLYVANADVGKRSLANLLDEHLAVRLSSIAFFNGLTQEQLAYKGSMGVHGLSPRALAYIITGHEIHHTNVLQERYLGKLLNA